MKTRTFFIPIHLQPIYYKFFKGQRFPVAERLGKEGFYYPSSASLTDANSTTAPKTKRPR